jgi:molybdenum cofactor biosynthesis enzyme MoaA
MAAVPTPDHRADSYPEVPLLAFDVLWLYVAGTLCNIECAHCFVASSPSNRNHEMLTLEAVERHLKDAARLGVKEYYFTGGEPFMNRQILEMIEAALAQGPVTVLTNGLLIRPDTAARLRRIFDASPYSLDLRVSIDGWDAATNDPIRGAGTFDRILEGVRQLADAGLNPIITLTEAVAGVGTAEGRTRLLAFLRSLGLTKPRLKVMPLLRLGAEAGRTRAYVPWETLRGHTLSRSEAEPLGCASGRAVTSRGVFVCPILVDCADARRGDVLEASLGPTSLSQRACYTCHAQGLTCRT